MCGRVFVLAVAIVAGAIPRGESQQSCCIGEAGEMWGEKCKEVKGCPGSRAGVQEAVRDRNQSSREILQIIPADEFGARRLERVDLNGWKGGVLWSHQHCFHCLDDQAAFSDSEQAETLWKYEKHTPFFHNTLEKLLVIYSYAPKNGMFYVFV